MELLLILPAILAAIALTLLGIVRRKNNRIGRFVGGTLSTITFTVSFVVSAVEAVRYVSHVVLPAPYTSMFLILGAVLIALSTIASVILYLLVS